MTIHPPSLRFRQAQVADVPTLSQLVRESMTVWPYTARQLSAWHDSLAIESSDVMDLQVAEMDGQIVGFFGLSLKLGGWRLEHMWVARHLVGQGVGRVLMQRCLAVASSLGIAEVLIYAEPGAAAFYRAMGAEHLGFIRAPVIEQPDRVLPLFSLAIPLREE